MQIYRSLVSFYKRRLPALRLSVRRQRMAQDYALCRRADGGFDVRIASRLSEEAAILALIHEIGHALSWDRDKHPSDHGPEFGIGYAEAWRMYQTWLAS